jgi:DNA repair exonuclease SbcCD ATPase subunit
VLPSIYNGRVFRLSPVEELTRRLVEIEEASEQRARLAARLAHTEVVRQSLVAAINSLQGELSGEERDVARLERVSLTSLIHALLGTKEEKLARERQDVVDARMRLEASEAQKSAVERRLAGLRAELVEIGDLEPERDRIVREFVSFLDQHPEAAARLDPKVRRLFDLAGGVEDRLMLAPGVIQSLTSGKLTAIKESIAAARRASQALLVLDRALAEASGREVAEVPPLVHEIAAADLALREFSSEALDVHLLDPSADDFSTAVLDALSVAHDPPLVLHAPDARRQVQVRIDKIDRYLEDLHARLREPSLGR